MSLTLWPSDAVFRSVSQLCFLGGLALGACACAPPGGPASAQRSFLVQRLAPGVRIDVLDRSLEDWPADTQAWTLDASTPSEISQVDDLRGRTPASLTSGDIKLRVLMAHNREHWFIGVHVVDDRFVLANQPDHPYGGDCFEIFFAGEELDSIADTSDIVSSRDSALQPAFFQLNLPPTDTPPPRSAFSPYRTDARLIQLTATDPSWALSSSRRSDREWLAELRLPLALMSRAVQTSIRDGRPLRVAFDYLDYDGAPAPPHGVAPFFAFRPDNLLAPARVERDLHTPGLMPTVVFER